VSSEANPPSPRDTRDQYARQAACYAESSLHSSSESLDTVRHLAAASGADIALDVGTGAGFTAFILAADARRVVAADLTPEMLEQAQRLALEKGLGAKTEWTVAAAESLPFRNGSFDVVTCRYASHHFHDLPRALRELARVTQPDGRIVLCDVVAPECPGLVDLMNKLEQVRDPTHVWDYPPSEWRNRLLPAAGLAVRKIVAGRNPQLFSDWVHRAGTSRPAVKQLTQMFRDATNEAQRSFDIRVESSEILFSWDNATILATKS
jgi:ubiquinone/menaquinone biosynthesis C-methylase UbiE